VATFGPIEPLKGASEWGVNARGVYLSVNRHPRNRRTTGHLKDALHKGAFPHPAVINLKNMLVIATRYFESPPVVLNLVLVLYTLLCFVFFTGTDSKQYGFITSTPKPHWHVRCWRQDLEGRMHSKHPH
jgi:hypothetical protein